MTLADETRTGCMLLALAPMAPPAILPLQYWRVADPIWSAESANDR
jgi:hypothetical protein